MQPTILNTSSPPADTDLAIRYHVVSVDKAQSPPNGADGDWYCYVLAGGRTPITGLRRGSLIEVTEHAKRCAKDLNDRSNGKRLSAWAPRRSRITC